VRALADELRAGVDALREEGARSREDAGVLRAQLAAAQEAGAAGMDRDEVEAHVGDLRRWLDSVEHRLAGLAHRGELEARLHDLRAALGERAEGLEQRVGRVAEDAARWTQEAHASAQEHAQDLARGADERLGALEARAAQAEGAVADAGEAREAAQRALGTAEDARATAHAAAEDAGGARELAGRVHGDLHALEARASDTRGDVGAVLDALAGMRTEFEAGLAEARGRADAAEARIGTLQAELEVTRCALTELSGPAVAAAKAGPAAAQGRGGGDVGDVFRELLAAAAGRGAGAKAGRRSDLAVLAGRQGTGEPAAPRPEPGRAPRRGFDDVAQPQAVIGLDGRFKELNPPFARLVGYGEHEFRKAMWPSPHDRMLLASQQEQFEQLARGELDVVLVQSTYMHSQGLMVRVAGELALVRGDDGAPAHLLLQASEH